MDSATAKTFISAGKAIFTVENPEGKHYTFKVKRMKDRHSDRLLDSAFLSVLTGPENTRDYTYAGVLDLQTGKVRTTAKSKISADAVSFKVAAYFVGLIWKGGTIPNGYKVHHEGRCGRCGRLLTVPSSIESGLGPECASILTGG